MEEIKELRSYMSIPVRELLCEAMILDIEAYNKDQLKHINTLLVTMIASGSYSFFTVQGLGRVTDAMANHEAFRRFVLSLYETTNMLRVSFNDQNTDWLETYKQAIIVTRAAYSPGVNSVLVDPLFQWLSITEKGLKEMLHNNPWLVTLYLACYTGAATKVMSDYNDYSGFLEEQPAE